MHRLAGRDAVDIDDLREERLLVRTYCEHADELADFLRGNGIAVEHAHEVNSERDLLTLLDANLGVAIVPRSAAAASSLSRASIKGLELHRTVYLYGVAGRQRTAVASTIMKMLRGADWTNRLN